jgi:Dolichyl-phosphate-mannose-protein mannosyltransferase
MDQGSNSPADLKSRLPWRILAGLLLALLAQSLLEVPPLNPVRHPLLGVPIYISAVLLFLWAWQKRELNLSPLPGTNFHLDDMEAHWGLATLALVVLLLSFFLFKGGLFTITNLAVWLLGLGLLVWAFWDPAPGSELQRGKFQERIKLQISRIKFSRWAVIFLLAAGLVVFFRVYQLTSVPPEPISDHAEKLLDIYDVLHGKTSIFFPRNTGREAFQFYLTAFVAILFRTGVSFLSLKIGTTIAGLVSVFFIFLLAKEMGGWRVALLALILAGTSYWGNVISRFGLRYVFYALFAAATFYFLFRGLRRSSRNDIIVAGLMLGLGMHGYTSFRIMPFIVLIAFGLYWLHPQSRGMRVQSVFWFGLVFLVGLMVALPLVRYTLENPQIVFYRSMTRLTSAERAITDPVWKILLINTGRALAMPFWNDGNVWAHSIVKRPALDLVGAALFLPGMAAVLARYFRTHDWRDLFLVLSVPLLMIPSILSIAFPTENPALNRPSAAIIPIFIVIAIFLDGIMFSMEQAWQNRTGTFAAWSLTVLLIAFSCWQNYDLVFRQYVQQYGRYDWNSTEMGGVVRKFLDSGNTIQQVFILEYPYWVDSRLISIAAGHPEINPIIKPEELFHTVKTPPPLIFLVNQNDLSTLETLTMLYPQGILNRYTSDTPRHDFLVYYVPASSNP